MHPLKTYDFLILSRDRIFDAVRPMTPEQYLHRFPYALVTIGATLTHMMVSEWYYFERFRGRPVPPYEQWEIQYEQPPVFGVVETKWREQQREIRAVIEAERDWNRRIEYDTFPDDDNKRFHIGATSGDILTQLALHEMHHRAQLLIMRRELLPSAPMVLDLDYNDLMYERRELK